LPTVASLLVNLGIRADGTVDAKQKLAGLKREAASAGDAAEQSEGKFSKFASLVEKGVAGAMKVAATAIASATAALTALVLAKTDTMDKTLELSTAVGVEVEELIRLQHAAKMSGLSGEGLEKGLKSLNKTMLELQSGGGGKAKQALEDLGISFEQLNELDGASSQIGLIGDRLKEIPLQAERSALAAQIFGKSAGPEMAMLLNEGSEGITKLMMETKGVFTTEDAQRAADFNDRIDELKDFVDGLTYGLVNDLLPILLEVADGVQMWLEANEGLIQQRLEQAIEFITFVIGDLLGELGAAIDLIGALSKALDGASESSSLFAKFLAGIWNAIREGMRPLQNLRTLAGEIAYLLENIGVISMKSADEFNDSIGNMEHAGGAGVDRLSGKFDGLRGSIHGVRQELFDMQQDVAETLFDMSSEEGQREQARLRARQERLAKSKGQRKSGGGSKKEKAPKVSKPELNTITVEQAIDRFMGGDIAATMASNIAAISSPSAAVADVKPSAVINYTDNSTTNVNVRQDIKSTDPGAAGNESAAAIKRMMKRSARAIPNEVVR
jgi:hypothetical protein